MSVKVGFLRIVWKGLWIKDIIRPFSHAKNVYLPPHFKVLLVASLLSPPSSSFHLTSDFHYLTGSSWNCFLSLSSFLCTSLHHLLLTLCFVCLRACLFLSSCRSRSTLHFAPPSNILCITTFLAPFLSSTCNKPSSPKNRRESISLLALSPSSKMLSFLAKINVCQSHPKSSDKGC